VLKVDFTEIGILPKFYRNQIFPTKFTLPNFLHQKPFYFLLVLNHDDVTWNYPKREDMGKRRNF
jgi:hypothetical protein